MRASLNGHHEVVGTLSEGGADVNAKDKVRNQMMIIIMMLMMMMLIVLTIMMLMMIVINNEDGGDCR
jgi:hypothetical protein